MEGFGGQIEMVVVASEMSFRVRHDYQQFLGKSKFWETALFERQHLLGDSTFWATALSGDSAFWETAIFYQDTVYFCWKSHELTTYLRIDPAQDQRAGLHEQDSTDVCDG